MPGIPDNYYLDLKQLHERGWTRRLVDKYLGAEDRRIAVDHWANYTGKFTWFLGRVLEAEKSEQFSIDFEKSATRRRLSAEAIAMIVEIRQASIGLLDQLTPEDFKENETLTKLAGLLQKCVDKGMRIGHKC